MTKITEEEKDDLLDAIEKIKQNVVNDYNSDELDIGLAEGLSWRFSALNRIAEIINGLEIR